MTQVMNREGTSERGTIVRRSPIAELLGWDPFRNFFSGSPFGGMEVSRTDSGYALEFPVPGYKPGDVDVTCQDGLLTISGRSERRSFTRSLTIPSDVDEDRIEAKLEHGMLTLTLPTAPQGQPKKIQVKSN